jgi:RimJ/RimL family protein N-acetyltransferase
MIGEQIYLRILEKSDIYNTQKWMNDPEMSNVMGYLPNKPLLQQEQWYESILNDSTRDIFAICLIDNDEHIGNAALGKIDFISRNASLSIFIFDTENRGMGNGTEAIILLLDYAFNRVNLHRVYLRTSPHFIEAISVYRKLGFKEEGRLREHYFSNGNYQDKILFGILREEFRSQK